MTFKKYLRLRVALPFGILGCVGLSIWLHEVFEGTLGAFIPGAFGVILLFWFYASFGGCPKCQAAMGKNIGNSCKECGHVFSADDIVTKVKKR